LKQWGFLKNLPAQAWKYLGFVIRKRKREGKETDISVAEIKMPPQKVQKALSRYCYDPGNWEFRPRKHHSFRKESCLLIQDLDHLTRI